MKSSFSSKGKHTHQEENLLEATNGDSQTMLIAIYINAEPSLAPITADTAELGAPCRLNLRLRCGASDKALAETGGPKPDPQPRRERRPLTPHFF